MSPKILVLLGGTWHNFDAFADFLRSTLPAASITATRDVSALADLPHYDLCIMYTCLSENKEDGTPAELLFKDHHAAPLASWLAAGGAFLSVHSATVACQTSPLLEKISGGVFVGHPPSFAFTVYPTYAAHPITAGIPAFSVFDEFYIQRTSPDISIHMLALDRGTAHPMVWTRNQGQGRVAHIAMGHDSRVWNLPPYQQLIRQAVAWLAASRV